MWFRKGRDLDKRLRSKGGRSGRSERPKVHEKFQQRAAQARRRPWRVVGVLVVVAALISAVVYLFGWSSAFVVRDVTLTGAKGEVAQTAQTNAAIPVGQPLARIDTDEVEQRVLVDLRVATVDVGRSWPSTVTLELTLRKPALAVKQSGAKGVRLADEQGVVYDTVKKAPKSLPSVRASKGDLDPADLQAVLALPAALSPGVAKDSDNFTLTSTGDIEFTVGEIEVKWGDGRSPELKSRVLEGLLKQEGIDPEAEADPIAGPIVIDVSTPATPVVTGLQTAPPTH